MVCETAPQSLRDYAQRKGPDEAQLLPDELELPNEAILESCLSVLSLWHFGHSCGLLI
jgi:hypothetical protein